jgi:predicted DNA-binding transcriptional regulator AlpA
LLENRLANREPHNVRTLEANSRAVNSFDSDQVVAPKEVAALLGISQPTLYRLWARGEGPRRRQISPRRIGVRLRDLAEYLDRAAV